jgi:hypothetical protein
MMIQTAPAGDAHFISTMAEHNDLCGQFARAFGNERFEKPVPWEETVYAIAHHDRGWDEFDAAPVLDPESGLPTGVGGAKGPGGAETTRRSPDFNEKRHAYCGLLASMHTWGLYKDRYGFSEFRVRKAGGISVPIGADVADETNAILDGEVVRQERLKAMLADNPETRPWIEDDRLFANYKLMQFCDTLALYFNLRHESERETETFVHVPERPGRDTDITVTPLGDNVYSFAPFPFESDPLVVHCAGRYLKPVQGDADIAALLGGLKTEEQTFTFVAG